MVCRLLSVAILCSSLAALGQSSMSFRDYSVSLKFRGRPAAPLHNTLNSRFYRTKIREAVENRPNFADHYTLAQWGCGSACVRFSIIDSKDGRVYDFPSTVSWNDEEPSGVIFRRDSRAVHMVGQLDEDGKSRDRWYVWDGHALLMKSVQAACHLDTQKCGNRDSIGPAAH
jgi:hypothetical protein